MADTIPAKLVWLVVGGIVGGAISLSYKTFIEPIFSPKPKLTFSAKSLVQPNARLVLSNEGNAVAKDVSVMVWATAVFAARTDIVEATHAGGATDANCEIRIYEAKLLGIKTSIPTPLNTEAKAALIRCDRMLPGESWSGSIVYQGPEGVFGLTALLKDNRSTETVYRRFAESE